VRDAWAGFVQDLWEQRPALIGSPLIEVLPRLPADDLYRAIVACAEDFCRRGRQKVRFYVEGSEIDLLGGGHQALLPALRDRSFEGYDRRIRATYPDYGLVIADWHQFDGGLWARIVTAVKPLLERVGISAARMDTQMFLGTYKVTPFGVHIDATTAFHFPVVGTKTMRFWDADAVSRHAGLRGAQDYSRFLDGSVAITARSGEALYWPSNRWHVGESDGSFAVTWGVGYWVGHDMRDLAMHKALRSLEAAVALPLTPPPPDDDLLAATEASLREALASDGFREAFVRTWLEHHSALGFLRVPPPLEIIELEPRTALRRRPAFAIHHARATATSSCIAAAGRSCVVPASPELEQLVQALNTRGEVTLAELLGLAEPAIVHRVVEVALRSGALVAD